MEQKPWGLSGPPWVPRSPPSISHQGFTTHPGPDHTQPHSQENNWARRMSCAKQRTLLLSVLPNGQPAPPWAPSHPPLPNGPQGIFVPTPGTLTSLEIQEEPAIAEVEMGVIPVLVHQFKEL